MDNGMMTNTMIDQFKDRHIGIDRNDQQAMLQQLGFASIEEMIKTTIPPAILSDQPLDLPAGITEQQALAELRSIADKNQVFQSYIGQGYYGTYTPNVILRNVLENPGWYTAYTPYQPEISQGRLEALLNFQTMVMDLTGMNMANASLLDEATAAAEAMGLCHRSSRSKSNRFFVDKNCFPQTIAVLQTRAPDLGIELVIDDPQSFVNEDQADYFGVLLQYPNKEGAVIDHAELIAAAHSRKTLVVMAADILSLLLLKSPGDIGADIAVGCTQRFGVPLGFGGPHAAYIACKEAFKRSLPGRIVGVSKDSHGQPAYRLALQTREQHIRREKATSNICTAQALLAIMASCYAVYHGPQGLRNIALRVHHLTSLLACGLKQMGYQLKHQQFFDTITLVTQDQTTKLHQLANDQQINLGLVDDQHLRIAVDETTSIDDVEKLWSLFVQASDVNTQLPDTNKLDQQQFSIVSDLLRTDAVLTHPVFNSYHSETEMLRYLRHLADKDIALDRAMIPLGSCTMKLNASAEMLPVTWPEFANIHPFAPAQQTQGYRQLISELEQQLCQITGYSAVSLQPNAGSQGEYAGLLAIKAYHHSNGQGQRDICLIPSSAHGTNPASAQMCGMRIVVVACDEQGNIDISDLQAKAELHSQQLAAIMITYPSTHGVFEANITEVCALVHDHGGQVYIDGANLNAMVGCCYPGKFGGDVSHLNLHKTFCIPHGGGGPGIGPIGVGAHLAKFLPNHADLDSGSPVGPVAAAAWGSAGILPITWMYIRMMGSSLTQATEAAILSANYIAKRLNPHYPVLYSGNQSTVAHECIIDCRPLKELTGIDVEDIAKRLIDYGFHAPTMSFPVSGTLMIEPTESESKAEIDRFCDAMISIRQEVAEIENKNMDAEDNPLTNAPHTAHHLISSEWTSAYSKEQAAYPDSRLLQRKYWPPVGRVDNVYGDRNLFCSCPAIADFESA